MSHWGVPDTNSIPKQKEETKRICQGQPWCWGDICYEPLHSRIERGDQRWHFSSKKSIHSRNSFRGSEETAEEGVRTRQENAFGTVSMTERPKGRDSGFPDTCGPVTLSQITVEKMKITRESPCSQTLLRELKHRVFISCVERKSRCGAQCRDLLFWRDDLSRKKKIAN